MKCCYSIKWKSGKKLDHHLTAFKVWKCACTLHRQRKANLHFLNSLLLEIPFCNWHAKHHTLHLLQDEALNAYSFPLWKHLSATIFHGFTTFLQVYFTPNGSSSNEIICCLWPHLIWAGAWAAWPSEAPSSHSALWCPWTSFRAPSCWMHVCSSYIRTLTFFTLIQQNKTWTWNYMHTNNSV